LLPDKPFNAGRYPHDDFIITVYGEVAPQLTVEEQRYRACVIRTLALVPRIVNILAIPMRAEQAGPFARWLPGDGRECGGSGKDFERISLAT
jgi:hypothetical protein